MPSLTVHEGANGKSRSRSDGVYRRSSLSVEPKNRAQTRELVTLAYGEVCRSRSNRKNDRDRLNIVRVGRKANPRCVLACTEFAMRTRGGACSGSRKSPASRCLISPPIPGSSQRNLSGFVPLGSRKGFSFAQNNTHELPGHPLRAASSADISTEVDNERRCACLTGSRLLRLAADVREERSAFRGALRWVSSHPAASEVALASGSASSNMKPLP